jgi:hypothetical protein
MQERHVSTLANRIAVEQPLFGATLLTAWEAATSEVPLARPLTLLRAGCPALGTLDAAALPLTLRDHALVALHVRSFGPTFSATVNCGPCDERLEFVLPAEQIAVSLQEVDVDDTVGQDGVTLRLRIANTRDVVDAAAAPDLQAARLLLLSRCADAVNSDGQIIPIPDSLRDAALDRLDLMHEAAEVVLTLVCPACDAQQEVYLDVARFLWAEVRHAAHRLLDEVHELAWAYGWPERCIVQMSSARRQAYLERLRG